MGGREDGGTWRDGVRWPKCVYGVVAYGQEAWTWQDGVQTQWFSLHWSMGGRREKWIWSVWRLHQVSLKCLSQIILYSGKLSKEKTFAYFAVLWLFAKVFSVKFGAWHSLARHKRAIRESFLHENRIFHQSAKVFSLESFPLYGINYHRSGNFHLKLFA